MATNSETPSPDAAQLPALTTHWLTPDAGANLLVVGPSLGTGVVPLWHCCAELVSASAAVDVLGWDLPGHGDGEPTSSAFTLEQLADAVVAAVQKVRPGSEFAHAGVSVGGATGLHLAFRDEVYGSAVICSGAKLGTEESWAERAETVRAQGTEALVEGSKERWFAPGFADREPEVAQHLLSTLIGADDESYAQVCGALGQHDVRARLGEIRIPVLVMGGMLDPVAEPDAQRELAGAIPDARLKLLGGVAHLAPAEAPEETARELAAWLTEI